MQQESQRTSQYLEGCSCCCLNTHTHLLKLQKSERKQWQKRERKKWFVAEWRRNITTAVCSWKSARLLVVRTSKHTQVRGQVNLYGWGPSGERNMIVIIIFIFRANIEQKIKEHTTSNWTEGTHNEDTSSWHVDSAQLLWGETLNFDYIHLCCCCSSSSSIVG